jgi:hypothetical protein
MNSLKTQQKELTIRTSHPLSQKLVNVWSAERASHNSLFSAKEKRQDDWIMLRASDALFFFAGAGTFG